MPDHKIGFCRSLQIFDQGAIIQLPVFGIVDFSIPRIMVEKDVPAEIGKNSNVIRKVCVPAVADEIIIKNRSSFYSVFFYKRGKLPVRSICKTDVV